ncbi:thioredoxin [Thioalkalivibrio denitrificans]|uniref:Thioredoxin n=1 Tax=Thioalkalivibrio denitrificans TaxID=108003 RepID=A0A1V3NED1_9GAMM|nr:thioredoxin fold domain-containing protein [Thioalkalivibrio denitrificans]OOG23156.1 thioredoxin [Thioalkalivibrio denitrificans]
MRRRVPGISALMIVLCILLPWATAAAQSADGNEVLEAIHPPWFKESLLDFQADLQDAIDDGKKGVMMYFGTRACSYCHALLTRTFAQEDLVERLQASFDVIGLEVLSDDEVRDFQGRSHWAKDFAVQEGARFTPTLIFYGEDAEVLVRLVGYVAPDRFSIVLDYLENEVYRQQSLREYVTAAEAVTRTDAGTIARDEALFAPPPHDLDRRSPAERPLLVLFERPDCTACERLHRTVLPVPSVREQIGQFDAVQLDMTDTESTLTLPDGTSMSPAAWADRLGLLHAPALVFFDEQGAEAVRVDSELLIDHFGAAVDDTTPRLVANVEARLQYVLERGYVEQPQFQRWRSRVMADSPR